MENVGEESFKKSTSPMLHYRCQLLALAIYVIHESFDHWKLDRTFLELPEVVILSVSVPRNLESIYSIDFQNIIEFHLRFAVNQYLQKRTIDRGNFDHSWFCVIEHQTGNVL